MTDITETTTEQALDGFGYAATDWSGRDDTDGKALGFLRFAQKIVDNDPRMQALKAAPEPTEKIRSDLRATAMEIQQDIQDAQDNFKRLNPDASEVQVEEYIAAVFEHDIVTLDRIQKEVQQESQDKAGAEASAQRNSAVLDATDFAQNGGMTENRFAGQGTKEGIRRILFGNS